MARENGVLIYVSGPDGELRRHFGITGEDEYGTLISSEIRELSEKYADGLRMR